MDAFIEKTILRNTIRAAFQRGNVYADNIIPRNKNILKDDIKTQLRNLSISYYNNVTEQQHIQNILFLSQNITENHNDILKENRFRIGTAQKLLNVYIKFLWCLGEINEPIHCPIDGIVLRQIDDHQNWTEIDSIDDYREIISRLRAIIPNNETIAQWEHRLWNRLA